MKFIPMLYQTPMVQSVLEKRKSQTRRTKGLNVINENPGDWELVFNNGKLLRKTKEAISMWVPTGIKFPYGEIGDVIWVRERFAKEEEWTEIEQMFHYFYFADGYDSFLDYKPSIHMPKVACRLFLQIKDIRVERLNDITEKDAIAEGVYYSEMFNFYECYLCSDGKGHKGTDMICKDGFKSSAVESFATLWDLINGHDSWKCNPWVWVIEFERIEKPNNFC